MSDSAPIPVDPDIEVLSPELPKNAEGAERVVLEGEYREEHNTSLLDPTVLEGIDRVVPGFAEKILNEWLEDNRTAREMAKKQNDAALENDKKIIEAEIENKKTEFVERKRGQSLAFGIAAIAIAAGVICALVGAQWTGSTIGGSGVVGLVYAFIRGKRPPAQKTPPAPPAENTDTLPAEQQ